MDKKRRIIARGVPRNRELRFVEDTKGSNRILTYKSKAMAMAGFKYSGFYTWDRCVDYIEKEYGKGAKEGDYLEAVEAELIIKI